MKFNMHGTTTIGIVCREGVVLISDKRASLGNLVAHKIVKKTFEIDRHIGATVAGVVGDAQMLIKYARFEAKLYKMRRGEEISTNAIANLLAYILSSYRLFPFIVQLLVAGYDRTGPRLFSLDPLGGVIEDKYVSTGSGSPVAYGILQSFYRENMNLDETIELGARALKACIERDVFTGDGIDIATVTKDGFKLFSKEEVENVLKKIK